MHMRAAKPMDWEIEPLPSQRTTIFIERTFSEEAMAQIRGGLIPEQQEDKWFIYWNDDALFFHRSWTGYCIYVVHFAKERGLWKMTKAEVNRNSEQYSENSDDKDAEMISYLMNVLLLHQDSEFPNKETSSEKAIVMNWSQVGRAMLGQHPTTPRDHNVPDNCSEDIRICGRTFYFKPAPHLRPDQDDWHTAYAEIITRFLNDLNVENSRIQLPAFPVLSSLPWGEMLFEVGSYWEGALFFLCRVLGSSTPLDGLRTIESAVDRNCLSFEQRLFMEIWNSNGQLKWLKAHLIREDKQHLLLHPISTAAELRAAAAGHNDEELHWLSSFVEQHEDEGSKYPNPYFGGTDPLHLGLILHEEHQDSVNLFTDYKQQEDRFTNGLVSILKLAELQDRTFISSFFRDLLNIELHAPSICAQVLRGYDVKSNADAVFLASNTRVCLESKIVSASLRQEQIQKHLQNLQKAPEDVRYLVLLTPDDSGSSYIGAYLDTDASHMKHLEWRCVYDYLSRYERNCTNSVLRTVVKQFIATIKSMIFEQDIAGIISKVSFGNKSGVYADSYLDDLRNGKWDKWNTPKLYKNLDGTGGLALR